MTLIEKQIVDKIEVLEYNLIQIRTANIIEKDNNQIAKTYHRKLLSPGDDLTNEDVKVKNIANLLWTEEVINEFKTLNTTL